MIRKYGVWGWMKRESCLLKHIVVLQVDMKAKIAQRRRNIDKHSQKLKRRLENHNFQNLSSDWQYLKVTFCYIKRTSMPVVSICVVDDNSNITPTKTKIHAIRSVHINTYANKQNNVIPTSVATSSSERRWGCHLTVRWWP